MRYPVGVTGTKKEFESKWYSAQRFGNETSYGYHDGEDINSLTGGNTDLGQPLYAVGDGKIVYYHSASHPNTGFGIHMVLETDTKYGKRWWHYAHCQTITKEVKRFKEGDKIGTLGKSGTTFAHLHFSCFKVDPATLSKGIDSIAKTSIDLNKYWEDPTALIDKLNQEADNDDMNFIDLKKRLGDTSWSELKEFSDLEKLGLIERADSIQTMMMKWLKSYAELQILHDERGRTVENLITENTRLTKALEDLKTSSTAEVDLLLERHKKEIGLLEKQIANYSLETTVLRDKNLELVALLEEADNSPMIKIDFSKLISFLKTWIKK